MAYGSAYTDTIASSGNLAITGNVVVSANIAGTGNITSSDGILYPLIATTPVATTSGTTANIATSIPSWVKRITVVLNQVSVTTTTVLPSIQLGYGSTPTYQTTGYNSASDNFTSASGPVTTSTTGFVVGSAGAGAWYSNYVLYNIPSSNIWVGSMSGSSASSVVLGGGVVTLSDTLTAVRLIISSSTFSAGSAFILYE